MALFWDAAAWLAMVGLLEPVAAAMGAAAPSLPLAVRRLLATVPVALGAYGAHAVGLPPAPWLGPIECMGISPLGWAGLVGGAAGWGWRAVGGLGHRNRGLVPPLAHRRLSGHVATWLPLLALPYALLPPWAIDETAYHLALPARARALGHLAAPLGHGNGGFFALADWLGSWGLAMGSVSAARGVQALIVHLALAAALALAPGLSGSWLSAFGVWLAAPVVLWQLGTAYVDAAAAAYLLVAVLLLAHSTATPRPFTEPSIVGRPEEREWAGALLLGAAIATKMTTLPLLAVLAWRTPHAAVGPFGGRGRLVAWAALPWLGFCWSNVLRYHSPLFPFSAAAWPGGEALLPAQWDVLQAFLGHHGPVGADGAALTGWRRVLMVPWALVFDSGFASPRFDGVIGGAPLVVAAVAVAQATARRPLLRARFGIHDAVDDARHMPHRRELLVACSVCVVGWLITSWQARFLIPALLLLLAWGCLVGVHLRAPIRAGLLASALASQVAFWPSLRGHLPPLWPPAHGSNAERARLRQLGSPASALCERLGAATSGLMLVWTQRLLLWCPAASVADSYDEGARIDAILDRDDFTPALGNAALRALGVTHLLVDEGLWLGEPPGLGPAERRALATRIRRWRRWQASFEELGASAGVRLLQLR